MTWSDAYDFWFGSPGSESHGKVRDFWFGGGPEIDTEITERFSGTYDVAISGRLEPWTAEPRGALSLIIVLDQFPRNMFRGNAKSFASDHLALSNAKKLLESPAHLGLTMVEKMFAYLPFEHSENLDDQNRSVALFQALDAYEDKDEWIQFAVEHRGIIVRFGRFPHRNSIIGRDSTPEEDAWLTESDQRFGTVAEDDPLA